jgi:dipeptidyl aminopeptidase/acylaminoacyl peptidase
MTRIVPYGGSYGGYMVYAAMIMFPERFAAGIDIVGIGNLRTFLENTSEFRRDLRRAEYGDERDPAMRKWMDETSSLANASKIKRPMFIIHGDNDPRVPVSEAHAMVAEFRKQGLETWLMTANDEGHGFAKKANQEAQREAETLFLRKVLKLN